MTMHHAPRSARAASLLLASLCTAGAAGAAGIERTVPSTTRILYEDGLYAEFGVIYTNPDQSGDDAYLGFTGNDVTVFGNTGDVFDSYWTFSAAVKGDINPNLSYAIIYDQPYGANTYYGDAPMTNPAIPGVAFNYEGTAADLSTNDFSGILAYDVPNGFKLFAGVRAEVLDASAAVPFIGPSAGLPGYTVDADTSWAWGYLFGAAWSRPDIAARVALTYFSKIEHNDVETDEFGGVPIPGLQDGPTETDITMPQSVALEGQSGVAPGTLVFGSIRWVNWADFEIAPPSYTAVVGAPLVDYTDDWWTYNLGIAHQITDTLAGSLAVTYEPQVGGQLTTLGPWDGRTMATAALSYDYASFNITGGLSYGKLGDTSNVLDTDFDDGSIWAAGLRVGYNF